MNVVELQAPRLVWSCSVKEAASGMYILLCGSFITGSAALGRLARRRRLIRSRQHGAR